MKMPEAPARAADILESEIAKWACDVTGIMLAAGKGSQRPVAAMLTWEMENGEMRIATWPPSHVTMDGFIRRLENEA